MAKVPHMNIDNNYYKLYIAIVMIVQCTHKYLNEYRITLSTNVMHACAPAPAQPMHEYMGGGEMFIMPHDYYAMRT